MKCHCKGDDASDVELQQLPSILAGGSWQSLRVLLVFTFRKVTNHSCAFIESHGDQRLPGTYKIALTLITEAAGHGHPFCGASNEKNEHWIEPVGKKLFAPPHLLGTFELIGTRHSFEASPEWKRIEQTGDFALLTADRPHICAQHFSWNVLRQVEVRTHFGSHASVHVDKDSSE